MAIVATAPTDEGKVQLYDVPDSELSKYQISGDKAAQMFPENPSPDRVFKMKTKDMAGADDVQSYNNWCICTYWYCNAYGCWWQRYWCAC